ncbi:hypothetical protein E0K83_09515 [Gramella sp. BOM4]|nr:hypothetical protein [Christiangramia bathymodioli]
MVCRYSDVTSKLEEWNQKGTFRGKLDLNRIGVFGHSRGGGAAGDALLKSDKIKLGANIDGVQWGDIVDNRFQKPFMFISADWPDEHEDFNSHAYVNKSNDVFYKAWIHGSAHSNFMDIPFMIPLKELSQAGEIDPYLGMQLTTKLVISFFDKHLKKKNLDINSLASEYDSLELSIDRPDPELTEN